VRWAIAGCGWIARDHVVPAMRAAGHELVAACDPDVDRARALAPSHVATAALDELLATAPDALYVATPNATHRAVVEAACAAGVDVLCEKPLATSREDAAAMHAAAAAAGVRLVTAHNQRFHPAHVALRAAIAEGRLGQVTQVAIDYACSCPPWWGPGDWHFDPRTAGGGAVFDLAPHGLDLAAMLLDAELAETTTLRQRATWDLPVEDGGMVLARLQPGDVLLVVQVSYARPETLPRRTLRVDGTAGQAILRDTMGQTPGGTATCISARDGAAQPLPFDPDGDPFEGMLRAFAAGWTGAAAHQQDVMEALTA
jgi:1,5-anhydro-D-fructose reductase (1,5-anhydro-D-mannitol-forming)